MGYRSDLKAVITTDKKVIEAEKILSWLDKKAYDDLKKLNDINFKIVNEGNIQKIYFQADNVKWYGDFSEVGAFHAWLSKISEYIDDLENKKVEYDGLGYHYVRIGENSDDLDEVYEGTPAEYINIFRGLEFNSDVE